MEKPHEEISKQSDRIEIGKSRKEWLEQLAQEHYEREYATKELVLSSPLSFRSHYVSEGQERSNDFRVVGHRVQRNGKIELLCIINERLELMDFDELKDDETIRWFVITP